MPSYAIGVITLTLVVGALAFAAVFARRLLLPDWSGAPARLAEVVLGVAGLTIVAELLGTVGGFREWALVIACAALPLAPWLAGRRWGWHHTGLRGSPDATGRSTSTSGIAILAVVVTAAAWLEKTLLALERGMVEYDTLWYHMPFAARFAQDGWITRLHYVGNAPTSFLPANSELIHAAGIVAFGSDALSPLLNLGWLALAFLAAWCIGRPYGVSSASVCAVALVASLPVMVESQAGTAKNDIAGMALFLAAVGLVVNGRDVPSATAVAGLSAGLAVGTRVTLIPAVVALSVTAIALAPRLVRRRFAVLWSLAVFAAGSFWYLRNLARVGNPFPWFGLDMGPLALPSTTPPIDCGTTTLAGYASNVDALRADILPFVPVAFGGAWFGVLGLALVGTVAALGSGRSRAFALGGVALVSGVAYLVTPATAGGEAARCFYYNTRFAAPALALAIVCVPLALTGRWTRGDVIRERWLAGAIAAVLAFTLPLRPGPRALFLAIVVVGLVLAAGPLRARLSTTRLAGVVAVAAAVTLVLGWMTQREHLDRRYEHGGLPEAIGPSYEVLRDEEDARVAVAGFFAHYPLYGRSLENRVEFPTRGPRRARFAALDCRSWQRVLEQRGYDYVITLRSGAQDPPEREWTERHPGADVVLATRGNAVFTLAERTGADSQSTTCPG